MHQQLQNLIIIYCIVSFLFLLTIIVRLYNGKDITFLRKIENSRSKSINSKPKSRN